MLPQNCGIVAVELRRPKVYKIINFFSTRCSTLRAGRWFFNLHQLIYITCITWARFLLKIYPPCSSWGNFVTQIWPFQNWRRKWSEYLDRAFTTLRRGWAAQALIKTTWNLGFLSIPFVPWEEAVPFEPKALTETCCWLSDITFWINPCFVSLHPLWLIWLDTVIPAACNSKNPGSTSRTVDLVSVVCFCKCADSRLWVLVCSSNPGHKSGFCTCFVQLRTVIPWFLLKNTSLKPVFFLWKGMQTYTSYVGWRLPTEFRIHSHNLHWMRYWYSAVPW